MKSSIWRALFETDSHDETAVKKQQLLDSGAAQIICQNSFFTVVKINTYEAAKFYDWDSNWRFSKNSQYFYECLVVFPIYIILRISTQNTNEPNYAFYKGPFNIDPRLYDMSDEAIWVCDYFKQDINKFPKEFWKIMVGSNFRYLEYIDNPSIELQLLAIKNDPDAIKYIKSPAPMVQWAAFKQLPDSIELVQPPNCRDPGLVEKLEDIKAQRGY